jgi:photosynthetic reaction center H subunit
MGTGAITNYVDVAQLVLYLFWIFFAGLIYYLVRENHREGYPVESEGRGLEGWPIPAPKTYRLADGSEVQVPRREAPEVVVNAEPTQRWYGVPLEPTGDPLSAGVGPGAWARRADVPDHDHHGQPKIVPLRTVPTFGVSASDPDPRGMPVYGADGAVAGTVSDLWIDTCETMFRYLEVVPAGASHPVLLPVTFARIRADHVHVHALMAAQLAGVPRTRHTEQVTMLEEEKITAYYGAGTLYADPSRAEPRA